MGQLIVYLAVVALVWPDVLLGAEELLFQQPSSSERLNHVLGSEGGMQVYKDSDGTVSTTIDPPGGERRMTVQPAPSSALNLGPPLQLQQHAPFVTPHAGAPVEPYTQDFPQGAR